MKIILRIKISVTKMLMYNFIPYSAPEKCGASVILFLINLCICTLFLKLLTEKLYLK